jgi:hypothetical protein
MKANRKTLTYSGDRRDAYAAGQKLIMKWNKEWLIIAVRYDSGKNLTYIRLEKK